ncbi:MAG: CBS and ACT domain-containing protein [bacterium]
MFVKMWMSPNPITIEEDVSILDAQKVMKDNKIRRLPVMRGGKLVGIVTESDIKEASPSEASTLSVYELHYLLAKMTVGDIMTKNPVTITPDATIEEAALIMRDRHISGLPVVDRGKLVGIVTESDIFNVFIEIMGLRSQGTRITFELEHKPGALLKITEIIKEHDLNISSIVTSHTYTEDKRMVVVRVAGIETDEMVEELREKGYNIIHVLKA